MLFFSVYFKSNLASLCNRWVVGRERNCKWKLKSSLGENWKLYRNLFPERLLLLLNKPALHFSESLPLFLLSKYLYLNLFFHF